MNLLLWLYDPTGKRSGLLSRAISRVSERLPDPRRIGDGKRRVPLVIASRRGVSAFHTERLCSGAAYSKSCSRRTDRWIGSIWRQIFRKGTGLKFFGVSAVPLLATMTAREGGSMLRWQSSFDQVESSERNRRWKRPGCAGQIKRSASMASLRTL